MWPVGIYRYVPPIVKQGACGELPDGCQTRGPGCPRRLIVDLANDGDDVTDPDATVVEHQGHRVELSVDPRKVSPAELIARVTAKHAIRDLFVENPPIEKIIAQLYDEVGA